MRESQALTNAIVESTSDFIWTVDPERFGLLTFNGGLSEHFLKRGVRLQKGMRPEEAFPDQNLAARWRGIYQRTLSEGSCTVDYESPTAGSMLVTANLLKRDGKVFGISAEQNYGIRQRWGWGRRIATPARASGPSDEG